MNKPNDPGCIQRIQCNILIFISTWLITSFFNFIKHKVIKFIVKKDCGRVEPGFIIRNHKGTITIAQQKDN